MTDDFESLERIKGRIILGLETEISEGVPINNEVKVETMIEIPLKIAFDEYTLFIYNKWCIVSNTLDAIENLKGKEIVDIKTIDKALEFKLSNLECIKVDLSDDGYIGPESLVLYGPDNLIIVWN